MGAGDTTLQHRLIHRSGTSRAFPVLVGLFLVACRTAAPPVPRYVVTAMPVDVLHAGFGLCVAVDPTDPHGVWWWQPGPSGCASRITGPTIFRAEPARVTASTDSKSIDVGFVLPTQSGNRDVNLVLQDSLMQVAGSDLRVLTVRRNDLEIPPAYGR